MAVIFLNHVRQKRLCRPKMRDCVYFESFLHHRVVCFKKTFAADDSGIVDQNRDISCELGSLFSDFVNFSAVAYVAFESVCFSASFSRNVFL